MNPRPHDVFFVPCPRGLEASLAHELTALGGQHVRQTSGGVECRGPLTFCYRVNLESRLASRILWRVGEEVCLTVDELYRRTVAQPWPERFAVQATFRVRVVAQQSQLASLDFAVLRVKDAICDRFVQDCGRRPTVDRQHPDVPVVVYLNGPAVTWYLDMSGDPLFKRGWRQAAGEAPIRENLAAGILDLIGWTPSQVLLDPMCGAGTFLIEAAFKGKRVSPGRGRRFAFMHLSNFDAQAWAGIRQESAQAAQPGAVVALYGYDQDVGALEMARINTRSAGFSDIHWQQQDVLAMNPPAEQGMIVTNPPYGVRMGEHQALEAWYPEFGHVLKQRFAGWTAYVLTADLRVPKLIRLAPTRKIPLFNGPLEARLYEFQLVRGGNRKTARLARQSRKGSAHDGGSFRICE